MGHKCKAMTGEKLVISYNGDIIPCEAFKGIRDKYPEFVLGNINEGDTLEQASIRAAALPFFQALTACGSQDMVILLLRSTYDDRLKAMELFSATYSEERFIELISGRQYPTSDEIFWLVENYHEWIKEKR